ncbi:hypothetical protein DWY99_10325 [[Clostridium] leptum]|uniref:Peptidase M14 domain-containing protein n=1 Tax=[Clostridium] leptum TaxID=1535 RepID=A0A412AVQ2_9FIRM|nr:hypothetical protein DWY99_10325 [[Clostridium] leptum]
MVQLCSRRSRKEHLITALCGLHPSVSRRVIGKSLCGRSIDLLQLGAGDDPVLLCGAFHGMEWLTSLLLLRFTSQMAAALETGRLISDIKAGDFLRRHGVTVIPCINPDGVEISLHGSAAAGEYRELVHNVSCGDTFRWQANARGVDLNHNFNAGWEALHTLEREQGIYHRHLPGTVGNIRRASRKPDFYAISAAANISATL